MSPAATASKSDQKLLLTVAGAMLVLIVIAAILKPQTRPDDPRPTTTNSAPGGAKAAYLTLQAMGRSVSRWNKPLAEFNGEMNDAQAARTTLVLADPEYDAAEMKVLRSELARFLNRGGRVLAAGPSSSTLLPDDDETESHSRFNQICHTTPEGPGALARAGSVEFAEEGRWATANANVEVTQRCGSDAVVVRYAVGKGEVIWWTSTSPMDNDELHNDADLRLLLASLGDGRDIVFDESLHGAARTYWDIAKGLPLRWLTLQAALLFALLIFSFSRRRGPLRSPVMLPRSSPVEFANSMGDLYEKAGATSAATDAARRRLLRVITREAGVAQQSVERGPEGIAEALEARLGGDWSKLREHLERCAEVQHSRIAERSALALVRALHEDVNAVRAKLKGSTSGGSESETAVAIG